MVADCEQCFIFCVSLEVCGKDKNHDGRKYDGLLWTGSGFPSGSLFAQNTITGFGHVLAVNSTV